MAKEDYFILLAKKAREQAYVPYSKFPVGAALVGENDEVILGCNVENASFGLTNCAERTAIFKAISEGKTKFKRLIVIADTEKPISPCGACRQVMVEFFPPTMEVVLANLNGEVLKTTVGELLPGAFKSEDLNT